jgi:hypothetical protein
MVTLHRSEYHLVQEANQRSTFHNKLDALWDMSESYEEMKYVSLQSACHE